MNVYRLILASLLLVFLTGCVAADDKPPVFRMKSIKVHIAKGGKGSMEFSTILSSKFASPNDEEKLDFLADYRATNRKTEIRKLDEGTVRVVNRGDFADVLDLVRAIDSSTPFGLPRQKPFAIHWSGKVLRLEIKYEYEQTGEANAPEVIVTTDGKFTENTSGELSEDGKKATIKGDGTHLILEIEGLGEK